jgi:hypothetical protein
MRRRSFIAGDACAGAFALPQLRGRVLAQPAGAMAEFDEMRQRILAAFPFELVTVPGDEALVTWEELKSADRGVPIVLGGMDDLLRIAEPLVPETGFPFRSAQEILAASDAIHYPEDFVAYRASEEAAAAEAVRALLENPDTQLPVMLSVGEDGNFVQLSEEEVRASLLAGNSEPELGEWPTEREGSPRLTVAYDISAGSPFPEVNIALIPASDASEIPAYLNWGGWNSNPPAEYHVTALHSWRERYGAELVGLSGDVMNVRLTRPPETREQAIELAWEQYRYCNDIVAQGVGSIRGLAGFLLYADWWFFWWD